MACGSRHIHGPMTGGADVATAAVFDGLICPADLVLRQLGGGLHAQRGETCRGDELVIESFIFEVALLFSDPLLQAHMRTNNEFAHFRLLCDGVNYYSTGRVRTSTEVALDIGEHAKQTLRELL